VYGFDYTNRLVAIPTEDYCIQFYNLFENAEVSEVSELSSHVYSILLWAVYQLVGVSHDWHFY